MRSGPSLDMLVKERLKRWPQRPPGLKPRRGKEAWLRGRPSEAPTGTYPFLKVPGSNRLRTIPDGLWLNFGGTFVEPFVDILAVEACSTVSNLYDKRSRFAPSTHSLLAVCPVEWLLGSVSDDEPIPRWKATGIMVREPVLPVVIPVRHMRVLYCLRSAHFDGFVRHQLPHAHEFFVPMETVTEENSESNPALRELLARASPSANFFSPIPVG